MRADPTSVIRDLFDAANHRDLDEVMTYFDDGATLRIEPPLPGLPLEAYLGKELIYSLWRDLLDEHSELRATNFQVQGNEVSWDTRISSDRFAQLGIDPVQARGHAIVEDSMIESLTLTLDPASVRRIQAAQAAQQQPG